MSQDNYGELRKSLIERRKEIIDGHTRTAPNQVPSKPSNLKKDIEAVLLEPYYRGKDRKGYSDFELAKDSAKIINLIESVTNKVLDKANERVNGALYIGLGREKTLDDIKSKLIGKE